MLVLVRSARRQFLLLFPFLVALSLVSTAALAQGRDKGAYCSQHGNLESCDGTLDCDRVWAEHVRAYHRGDGDGLDNVVAANFSPKGTPINLLVRSALLGGFSGTLAFAFVAANDSTSHALAGALGGTGLFLTAGVISNRGAWGLVASPVLGAASGAMLGASVGKFGEKSFRGTPEATKEQERTSSLTTAGAVAGAVVGLAFPIVSKQLGWPGAEWFAPGGRATLLGGSRRLGLSISW